MVAQDYECDLFWFRHVTWVLLLLMTLLGEFFDPGCGLLASQLAASSRQFVPLLILVIRLCAAQHREERRCDPSTRRVPITNPDAFGALAIGAATGTVLSIVSFDVAVARL